MFILRADSMDGEKSVQVCGDYKSLWHVFYSFLESKFACRLTISDGLTRYDPTKGGTPVSLKDGRSIVIEEAKPFRLVGAAVYIPQSETQFIPRHAEEKTLFDKSNSARRVGIGIDVGDILFKDIIRFVSQYTWEEITYSPPERMDTLP